MSKILSTIACNLDTQILAASLPLLEAEKIEAIEWSFDTLTQFNHIPEWYFELMKAFGNEKRLIGHGVYFSLFSGKWLQEQAVWLTRLREMSKEFQFDHITEHFGFMTGENFHNGAPLSIPFTKVTLAIGQDRLKRIQAACNCPVGLENLAFSYSIEEVKRHGDFLNQLIEPVNGFIILDLHNLYCQIHNFDIEFESIIQLYPLEKVREIHISGGSWEVVKSLTDKKIRRDTHDDGVPQMVFDLLEKTIPRCPNLKYVVMEQLGTGLKTEDSRLQFQTDFLKMDAIVQRVNQDKMGLILYSFLPCKPLTIDFFPIEDKELFHQQQLISKILETATNYEQAEKLLLESELSNTEWEVEKWQPFMLETAIAIAQKWKNGFVIN
jgi:uncharacterized protein